MYLPYLCRKQFNDKRAKVKGSKKITGEKSSGSFGNFIEKSYEKKEPEPINGIFFPDFLQPSFVTGNRIFRCIYKVMT